MTSDRDDSLAPAIRKALQDSRTDCPDVETVAAYADRALGRAERRDVERHLSGCARCRETLLLMSRAEQETATLSQERKKGGGPLYWLAGAATADLAVIVWMTFSPTQIQVPAPTGQAARVGDEADRDQAQSPPEAAPVERPKPVEPPRTVEQPAPADAKSGRSRANAKALPPAAAEARDRVAAVEEKRLDDLRKREASQERAEFQAPARAPAAPPPRAEPDAGIAANRQLMARGSPEFLIAFWPPAAASAGARVSPALAWRVWASGMVERSADGGATWIRDTTVDAPAARAIHVPSRDAVWIVGDNGLILRFETGRGWTRVPPPAPIGFVAVEASDALRAAITAADGRRFTTGDGGVSWK